MLSSAKNSVRTQRRFFFLIFCACSLLISWAQRLLSFSFFASLVLPFIIRVCLIAGLIFPALFICVPSHAAKVIVSSDDYHHLSLADYVDILALDGQGLVSVEQVFADYRQQFAPVNLNQYRQLDDYQGILWLRFAVFNGSAEAQEVWLSANVANIDQLHVYALENQAQGIFTEVDDALLQHENFAPLLKKLVLEAGETNHFYLSIKRKNAHDFQLQLLKPSVFFAERLASVSRYSIGFGLLAMLILLSGLLAAYRRSTVLLYQGLFSLVILAFVISSLGIPRGWFAVLKPISYWLILALFYLCNVVVLVQVRAYIQLEKMPKANQLFLREALIAVTIISVFLLLWQGQDSPWLWLPAVITAAFTLNAYWCSYRASHNSISLCIIALRLVTLLILSVVVYNAETVLALSQLLNPNILYYLIADGVLMTMLLFINDQQRYTQQQQQLLLTTSRNIQLQAQTALLSEVSHDLRSPVAGILGMSDLLQASMLTPTQQEHLQAIKDSGQTLLNQISAVNDRLQLQQDQQIVHRAAFELALLVEESVFAFRLQAEQRNIECVVNIHADVPVIVEGDAARLRQILQPMIANAVKYTSQGEVLIDVTCLAGEASLLLFSISDTGRGIDQQLLQELQQQCQNRRWKNDAALEDSEQKGLARVAYLLSQLGTSLFIESKLGEGSRFSFQLELTALENDAALDHAEMDYSILRNKRILIVDDNHSCCDVLKQQAKSWGMLVNTCYDGYEALAMFRAKRNLGEDFDVIIIDYDMPHLSGLQVAEKIRDEAQKMPQMIMLTGLNVMPTEHIIREAGIQVILNKPASRKLVKMTLSNLFHMQKRQQKDVAINKAVDRCRVLIVEDNDVSRRIISKMMELLSVDYKLVADGQLAVDAAQRERFDLIFMDCEMPVMNGFDATQEILHWQDKKQQVITPIIALSAHIMGEHKQRAMDVGMQDFLEKPVKLAELESVIQRFRP